jgi:SAM-dependent methyltransferase
MIVVNDDELVDGVLSWARPDFSRYKKMFLLGREESITRALQYEALEHTGISGCVLDVGGGTRAGYRQLLNSSTYDSINIDSALEPTWVVQIGERFPCPVDRYDEAISMNTLEHVFDARFIVGEVYRALKRGGRFACAVPFLYPIHGAPEDYFRPSPSWYFRTLSDVGFVDIGVKPLVWGPFSTGFVCSGAPGPFKTIRRHVALLSDLGYVSTVHWLRGTGTWSSNMFRFSVSFFVTARKR